MLSFDVAARAMNEAKTYWNAFCGPLSIPKDVVNGLFEKLIAKYASPTRYYHTLVGHIAACIREFGAVRHLAKDAIATEAALWMHDTYYERGSRTNEADSARWAVKVFRQSGAMLDFEKLKQLIMMTKDHCPGNDTDARIVSDCDLAILGKSKRVFTGYESNVRKEYAWVPEDVYRDRRAELLKALLERPQIYYTEFFYEKYEKRARANLRRSIAILISKKLST